jgi:peptidoglycan lytic transglycosylase G
VNSQKRDENETRRPPVRNRARRAAVIFLALLILLGGGAAGLAAAAWWLLSAVPTGAGTAGAATGGSETMIEIAPGETLRDVSQNLADLGLIRSALALRVYGRISGREASLQAGSYLISPPMSAVGILDKIAGGEAVFDEVSLSIPEGWTIGDIAARIESAGIFSGEEFVVAAVVSDDLREFGFLDGLPDGTSLEGYLFPDTYRVFRDASPADVVRLMLSRFRAQVIGDARVSYRGPAIAQEQSQSGLLSLHELVTLASIIQREAGGVAEMPAIAGVFRNRLDIRMPLESDATVNYALGTSRRQPTFADTAVQHPYNTYANYGLPPGPIGNPGLDAIVAAAEPELHDYLFLLHPLGGEVVLSRTYEEHLQNKRRYLD